MNGILLVDGYNVINNWSELAELKDSDLSHARDRLIAILSEFQSLYDMRVIVVFDAHLVKNGVEVREDCQGVEVIYTKEGVTADNWIERYAVLHHMETATKDIPLFVVTYDWLEQRIISSHGAYRVTPGELRQEILKLKKAGKRKFEGRYDPVLLDQHISSSTKKVLEKWRRRKF
ncbi:MAG TPA: NYN domain-containing protein [Syntrophomonadaceae bacterium]|nr:NYN domain-containing protein [Syntrophomonadaceae bacterium]